MDRDEILEYIYNLNFVEGYSRQLANTDDWDIIEDIIQEIYLQLCEVSNEKWQNLLKQGTTNDSFKAVRGYVAGLIHRNIRSKNSRAYYKLKRHWEKEIPIDDATMKIIEEIPDDEPQIFQ